MILNSFKVGWYKVFGAPVELNMVSETKNTQYLSENIIVRKEKILLKKIKKCDYLWWK